MQCPECGGTKFEANQHCWGFVDVIVDKANTYVENVDQDYLAAYDSLAWDMPEGPYFCVDCGAGEYTREELDSVSFKKEKVKAKEPVLRGGVTLKEDT
jgi:hypothetical protein